MLKRLFLAALAVVLLTGPASAGKYLNQVTLTAADTAAIWHFAAAAKGSTLTFADSQKVANWSASNSSTSVAVDLRIYTKAAPAYTGGSFADLYAQDYITLTIQPGQTQTLEGVELIGYRLDDTPTGGALTLLGWNR